ncbi:MAG: GH3 auxin-responsive promoter family protein [Clostridiales bacterium]|nr:GH3 auxin-responsive promoter family protein [Clostridiales bacterium]
MRFKTKLKKCSQQEIWDEYCGFLDLSIDEYMDIQYRLLHEQIELFSDSGMGKRIMHGQKPETPEEFRKTVPLTTYDDYADILLNQRKSMLPAEPVVWLETTWESGSRPKKLAPYSKQMLDIYSNNIIAAMILSTSEERGKFAVRSGDRALYGLAPLPYATGLFPLLIAPEIDLHFMPSIKDARNLSFSEQNKRGFYTAMKAGLDQFFGMSSVVYTITKNFEHFTSSGSVNLKNLIGIRPNMLVRILKAKYLSSRDNRPMMPKDIFDLKGFVCVGTDTSLFKEELEKNWGRKPLEIHGGTEPSCLGTETWSRNGLVFFPDNAFYEFIPVDEMLKNEADPDYVPKTYLMNEVTANRNYEIVLTLFKGGAFMRYRPGDVYRCLRTVNEHDNVMLPQFEYLDRIPTIIDIAGFTRITEASIKRVLELSRLPVGDWFALKEYDGDKRSFMHFYVELDTDTPESAFLNEQLIKEHFSAYFRHYDHDYNDLKRLLGIEPLKITILPVRSLKRYEDRFGSSMRKINPSMQDVIDLNHLLYDGIEMGSDGA